MCKLCASELRRRNFDGPDSAAAGKRMLNWVGFCISLWTEVGFENHFSEVANRIPIVPTVVTLMVASWST